MIIKTVNLTLEIGTGRLLLMKEPQKDTEF